MKVQVAAALPERQVVVELELHDGATVADALRAAAGMLAGLDVGGCDVGIWSRRCGRETPVRDGDRVELYRALTADAKSQRRERARIKPATRSRNGT